MSTATAPSSSLSARCTALLRSFRAAFSALDDFRAKNPAEASVVVASVAAHLRSSDPVTAAESVASVEMPAIVSPAVQPQIEPATEIDRKLHDGAGYLISLFRDKNDPMCIGVHLTDALDGSALVYMSPEQAEVLGSDVARVLASVVKR